MIQLALWGYVSELIQGVGFNCGGLLSCIGILLACVLISSLASMGTLCLLYFCGRTLASSVKKYSICHIVYLFEGIRERVLKSLQCC